MNTPFVKDLPMCKLLFFVYGKQQPFIPYFCNLYKCNEYRYFLVFDKQQSFIPYFDKEACKELSLNSIYIKKIVRLAQYEKHNY